VGRKNTSHRHLQRHKEALERQAAWDALTLEERLTKLQKRGFGNSAEAEYLYDQIKKKPKEESNEEID
jgi:hypothetical protein